MPDTHIDTRIAAAPPSDRAGRPVPGRTELVVMIAAIMALNALAIDIMLPALSQMAADLGLTATTGDNDNRQQLIIFAYVLGFGAPQLIWGPITDHFGRRAPLFVALVGYIIAAFACMLVKDFTAMLAMRFVQGVFASGARIAATSLVRDLFAGRAMASFMSLVMTIFMIVPILAPGIGQLILFVAPWEGIFGVLAAWAVMIGVWAWFRLPETLPMAARRPLSFASAGSAYLEVVRSPVTFGYMCASGVIFGALFAFVASSEQIMRVVFGEGERFALWFAGIAGALAVSNFVNSRIVERLGMRRISHGALIAFTVLAALNAGLTLAFGENLIRFFVLFALTFACFGMLGSNFSALALEPLGKLAGTASAAYGFATTTVSSLVGMAIGAQFDGTTVPLMTGFALIGVVSLVIVLITEKGRLFNSR
jgi:MFS transporter, DHA1 family, multidrug resistance protein